VFTNPHGNPLPNLWKANLWNILKIPKATLFPKWFVLLTPKVRKIFVRKLAVTLLLAKTKRQILATMVYLLDALLLPPNL